MNDFNDGLSRHKISVAHAIGPRTAAFMAFVNDGLAMCLGVEASCG